MIQKNYLNVNLNCVTQSQELSAHSCPVGVLTLTASGLQFTENPPSTPHTRNPKVVKGSMLTMVQKEGVKNFALGIKLHNPAFVDDPQQVIDTLAREYMRIWNYSHGIYDDNDNK